jgi:predicted dienelactone hydrolase
MQWLTFIPILCLSLLVAACSDDIPLPPVQPLVADEAALAGFPGANTQTHSVAAARNLILPASNDQREMQLNLYYPTDGSGYPLLFFSHGNWSNKDSYDRVIEYWVSHGYVVIAPDHLDCCSAVQGIFNSLRYGQLGLIEGRVVDLNRLLNALPALEELDADFAGKADPSRVGITGHSFGAFSAQQFGGAMAFDPDSKQYVQTETPNVRAIVALSPPGPMFDTITAGSWQELTTPTLVTTGTWDVEPRFWPDWRMHLMSWETSQPGDKYALVIDGADHYLGNLICRPEREGPPQEDALRMVQIVTTAFLDAYLKNDTMAMAFLADDRLAATTGNFAYLSRR